MSKSFLILFFTDSLKNNFIFLFKLLSIPFNSSMDENFPNKFPNLWFSFNSLLLFLKIFVKKKRHKKARRNYELLNFFFPTQLYKIIKIKNFFLSLSLVLRISSQMLKAIIIRRKLVTNAPFKWDPMILFPKWIEIRLVKL